MNFNNFFMNHKDKCLDFKEWIEEIDRIVMVASIHGCNFTGKIIKLCPFCGDKL